MCCLVSGEALVWRSGDRYGRTCPAAGTRGAAAWAEVDLRQGQGKTGRVARAGSTERSARGNRGSGQDIRQNTRFVYWGKNHKQLLSYGSAGRHEAVRRGNHDGPMGDGRRCRGVDFTDGEEWAQETRPWGSESGVRAGSGPELRVDDVMGWVLPKHAGGGHQLGLKKKREFLGPLGNPGRQLIASVISAGQGTRSRAGVERTRTRYSATLC